jgi:FAD synthase
VEGLQRGIRGRKSGCWGQSRQRIVIKGQHHPVRTKRVLAEPEPLHRRRQKVEHFEQLGFGEYIVVNIDTL